MASHAPQTILFVTNDGLVMTDGYTSRLGKGQFGIVDKGAAPTSLGLKVTTTLPTSDKNRLFELRLGAADLTPHRSQTNKSWSSVPFKLSEVVDISLAQPKMGLDVDTFIMGYDGINADSALTMSNGDNEIIDVTLSGEAIGMLGYTDAKVTLKMHLTAPLTGTFTMHEIVEKAVEDFKKQTLKGGVPVTNYITVNPVNSENPATVTGTDSSFFRLTITDEGKYTDLGKVQAQYPAYVVKREIYDQGKSTYVIIAPAGTVLADYVATDTTLADANCDGNPEVTNTTVETEWVEGETCTAIADVYTIQLADDKCGQDKLAALQAAYPELTISIDNSSANWVQTATITGVSGDLSLVINGTTYTTAFNVDLATTVADFVTAHAAAILAATGATVTGDAAVLTFEAPSNAFPTITAVAGGLTETLSEVVADAGTDVVGGCQTKYRTVVYSDVVCEECDEIMRDLFVTEAPAPYEWVSWTKAAKVYDADAKMGIFFKGKVNILSGSEEYRDEIPFIYSSTRIAIANEALYNVNESFNIGTNGRYAVKILARASEVSGLGKDLRDLEERTRVYFTAAPRHVGNNYAKAILGEESLLKPLKQYVTYSVRIRTNRFAQSWSGEVVENFNYLVVAELGKDTNVKTVINALATAAGLPTV